MELSNRLDLFGNEIFSTLNAKKMELEEQGKKVYNLSVGTPDFKTPQHVIDALVESAKDPNNWTYSLHDRKDMLQAVCDYYNRRFDIDNITPDMVCAVHGTQEGMSHLAMALINEGDTVLIPDPCYPVFENGSLLAGAKLEYYPLEAEHDFLPYVAGIDPEVAKKAKYMIVSLPSNPVGSVGNPQVYKEIIDFAHKYDVLIIHDNAYSDIVFDGPAGKSFFNFEGAQEIGIEFFSLSKSFNVTGARISFLVGNPEVIAGLKKLRSQLDFGMFYPVQQAAIAALRGPLDQVEEQRMMYQERRDALCESLEAIGWDRPNAHGTMFVWAKLPHGRQDSINFTLELMEKAGVIVTPGASFGPAGEGYVRMALVLPPEGLREAVDAIAKAGM